MTVWGWAAIWISVYILAVIAFDRPAHELVYPLVGYGHPLTGRRRWLLRIFGPIVFVGIWVCRVPMIFLAIFGTAGRRW